MPADLVPADDLDRLITIPEAAARLRIHRDTAYAWIRDNRFPVAIVDVNGHMRVSLRRLTDFMGGATIERRAS